MMKIRTKKRRRLSARRAARSRIPTRTKKRTKRNGRAGRRFRSRSDLCDYVRCGSPHLNRCRPSYAWPCSSMNWHYCNMSNWSKDKRNFNARQRASYAKLRGRCSPQSQADLRRVGSMRSKAKHTVDAVTMHQKMPYIWRFLRPQTRKRMIELARKPVTEINIPGHIFDDVRRSRRRGAWAASARASKLRRIYSDI